MPYMEAWDDFFAAAQRIQQAAPMRTRLWHKYRHDDGVLTIKVTDDREVRGRRPRRLARLPGGCPAGVPQVSCPQFPGAAWLPRCRSGVLC